MSDNDSDWPTAEQIRAASERSEGRRLRRSHEALARELRLARLAKDRPAEPSSRGLTANQIRRAAADIRAEVGGHPTVARVAEHLDTTEATLRRAMKDLGMERWPPGPAAD